MDPVASVWLANGDCSRATSGYTVTSLSTTIKDDVYRCHIFIGINTSVLEKGTIGGNVSDCFYDAFEAKRVNH